MNTQNIKFVVVDDVPDVVRGMVCLIREAGLKAYGIRVCQEDDIEPRPEEGIDECASSAEEVVKCILDQQPQIVLLDHFMGICNGQDVFTELREHSMDTTVCGISTEWLSYCDSCWTQKSDLGHPPTNEKFVRWICSLVEGS